MLDISVLLSLRPVSPDSECVSAVASPGLIPFFLFFLELPAKMIDWDQSQSVLHYPNK